MVDCFAELSWGCQAQTGLIPYKSNARLNNHIQEMAWLRGGNSNTQAVSKPLLIFYNDFYYSACHSVQNTGVRFAWPPCFVSGSVVRENNMIGHTTRQGCSHHSIQEAKGEGTILDSHFVLPGHNHTQWCDILLLESFPNVSTTSHLPMTPRGDMQIFMTWGSMGQVWSRLY